VYQVKIEDRFSAAHRLRDCGGKCEALHGHNWKVEVWVVSDSLNAEGMVLDFTILKGLTKKVLETVDHRFLNELPEFCENNPSSENIARYVFERLKADLQHHPVVLSRVTVWESETACASYCEDQLP
jgi:6-pyruvoyltetrahydropterin/6-carboxytetrahydropterin synthase